MRIGISLVSAVVFASLSSAYADVIDFESLPDVYMFTGGGQNIGSYYSGVDFEPNVTGLDLTGSTAFLPHSGSIAVWDPVDLTATIYFFDPESMVGVWYTSLDLLTLTAFDGSNNNLGSNVGAANTDGTTGSSDFLAITAPDIAYVTLVGPPGGYVFDDVTFTPQGTSSTPEPSSIVLVGICASVFLLGRRRLFRE